MKNIIMTGLMIVCGLGTHLSAQELFVYTEPASNMPAKSIGLRTSNWLTRNRIDHSTGYNLIPELMWGVNRNLMVHAEGFFSNSDRRLRAEGVGFYGKYRLYSVDEVHRHFRLAAFGRFVTNNSGIVQQEIDMNGHNSGYQAGLIATQLLHRQAISASANFTKAIDNSDGHSLLPGQPDKAINASLSTGRLLFPKIYSGYGQTNVNIMLELLGQQLIGPGPSRRYVDIAPAVQFIVNSQIRFDIGYKRELYSNMQRAYPNGFMIRVEYLFFNVL